MAMLYKPSATPGIGSNTDKFDNITIQVNAGLDFSWIFHVYMQDISALTVGKWKIVI